MSFNNDPASFFKFAEYDTFGAEAAEYDQEFLEKCFADFGTLEQLSNTTTLPSIVVGRTGSGKTALLTKLREQASNHAVWLDPIDLSLHYLSGSTILKELSKIGVRLDFFYKYLWNHILVVELIKVRYPATSSQGLSRAFETILNIFNRDTKKQAAQKYIETWRDTFWEKTEVRIKEATEKFESNLQGSLKAKIPTIDVGLSSNEKFSEEQKYEINQLAQEVVNSMQMTELSALVKLIKEELFASNLNRYYIIVDRLDEDWVEDDIRFRLIKSLMECVLDFGKVAGVKIVVALRKDLVERVFRVASSSGTQVEKFGSFYLQLTWSPDQLMKIADLRLGQLINRRYENKSVEFYDIFTRRIGKEETAKYLIDRTLYRPRDLIVFLNLCVQKAKGKTQITASDIREAEGEYSQNRLQSIYDEWRPDHPDLSQFIGLISGKRTTFKTKDIDTANIQDVCLNAAISHNPSSGPLTNLAQKVVDEVLKPESFRKELLMVFHNLGIVGLKKESSSVSWSFLNGQTFRPDEIKDETSVSICPAFYRALATKEKPVD